MTDNPQTTHDGSEGNGGDIRLAEYVLGVLDADARREVEADAAADAAKAERLLIWQERFSELTQQIEPREVPAELWARILARIEADAPHAVTHDMAEPPGVSWWESLRLWHWLSGVTSAVAIIAIVVLIVRQPAPTSAVNQTASQPTAAVSAQHALAATLKGDNGTSAFTVSFTPDHAHLVAIPTAAWNRSGKVPQLWLIAPGQKPKSLGVLAKSKPTVVTIPASMRRYANAGVAVAVSVEPPGGSPTGQPTGAVIAKGAVSSI